MSSVSPLLNIGTIMPSPHALGYSPFANSRLKSFNKKGDIMSYEVLNISAHKLSKPQLLPFFYENTAPLISDSEISESSS